MKGFIALCAAALLLSGCAAAPACAPPAAPPEPDEPPAVAFFGDSLTARCDLARFYPDCRCLNFGVDGDFACALASRLDEVVSAQPDAVVVLAGINDLAGLGSSPEQIADALDSLLTELQTRLPEARVLVQSLYPVRFSELLPIASRLNRQVPETNALLNALCDERGWEYVDAYSALADDSGERLDEACTEDGIHLNDEGYRRVSGVLNAALLQNS